MVVGVVVEIGVSEVEALMLRNFDFAVAGELIEFGEYEDESEFESEVGVLLLRRFSVVDLLPGVSVVVVDLLPGVFESVVEIGVEIGVEIEVSEVEVVVEVVGFGVELELPSGIELGSGSLEVFVVEVDVVVLKKVGFDGKLFSSEEPGDSVLEFSVVLLEEESARSENLQRA